MKTILGSQYQKIDSGPDLASPYTHPSTEHSNVYNYKDHLASYTLIVLLSFQN